MTKTATLQKRIELGELTLAELRELDPAEVRAMKRAAAGARRSCAAVPTVPRGTSPIDKAARTISYAGSVEIVDRMGDLVVQKGLDVANWKAAGGVFLWGHDHNQPIGQGLEAKRGMATWRKSEAPATLFKIAFLDPAEALIPFAEVAWRLASGIGTPTGKPVIKGSSIGFGVVEAREYSEEELEAGAPRYGLRFESTDLHELSLAVVPANQAALEDVGRSAKAAERAIRKQVHDAIEGMVQAGSIERSLADAFVREFGLSPGHAAERSREAVRSFVDLGAGSSSDVEDPAEIQPNDLFLEVDPAASEQRAQDDEDDDEDPEGDEDDPEDDDDEEDDEDDEDKALASLAGESPALRAIREAISEAIQAHARRLDAELLPKIRAVVTGAVEAAVAEASERLAPPRALRAIAQGDAVSAALGELEWAMDGLCSALQVAGESSAAPGDGQNKGAKPTLNQHRQASSLEELETAEEILDFDAFTAPKND